jgi:hypothetical protein
MVCDTKSKSKIGRQGIDFNSYTSLKNNIALGFCILLMSIVHARH